MRCRTLAARCTPARCPSGIRRNQSPVNTIGIPMSPTANTAVIRSRCSIHHTRAIARASGTPPPAKLMNTIRWPHVPRLKPIRLIVNQKKPQAALSASPPVRSPAQLSINRSVTMMTAPAPVQTSRILLPDWPSRICRQFPAPFPLPRCVRAEEK